MQTPSPGLLLAALLAMLLSACASNDIYRSNFDNCVVTAQEKCESHTIQQHNVGSDSEYLLGFVEIDDQGQLRNRAQMQAVLDELYALASRESVLINVFVHGWHHSAKPGDSNVESFKASLAELSRVEHQLHPEKAARRVVGVYVGWRGESIDVPWINNITFWDRKNTAHEVGYLGMAELLLKLEEIRNVKNTQEPPVKSRLVILGHSFGGAAVYSATAQILADRFINSRNGKNYIGDAEGFGDLVVLLNPAFEALKYAPLYDLAQARCSYFEEQAPRLVILTSEADYATKYAFPAGRVFSTFFETHGTIERNDCGKPLAYSEGAADRSTAGHFKPLQSHELRPAEKIRELDYRNVQKIWKKQQTKGVAQFGSTRLSSLDHTVEHNPYLNVRVDKQLIKDHNDVFGKEIMEFIRTLIVVSTGERESVTAGETK
ncbi:esterase [Nitrosomonas sp.]|uniref:esterase n=1 Tax=Nitrosomonas sp. TaxID=42353 RepID=UPI0025FF9E61|nr:esterase [Nitrosomonas sp.]